jgi:rhodanese-related sulfurtransferase
MTTFQQIVGWVTAGCCIVPVGIVFLRAGFRFGIFALVVVLILFAHGALTAVVCAADGAVVVIAVRSLWELVRSKWGAAITPRVRDEKKCLVETAFHVAKKDANRVVGLPPDEETRFLLSRAEDIAWQSIARKLWKKWGGTKKVAIALTAAAAVAAFWWVTRYEVIDGLAEDDTMQSIRVIDVRSEKEWDRGHVEEAIRISVETIAVEIEGQVDNKNEKIRLYCSSGTRAGRAKRKLLAMNYTNVRNIGSYERASRDIDAIRD